LQRPADAMSEPSPHTRVAWPVAAGALLVLVLGVLGGVMLLTRRDSAPPAAAPTAAPPAAAPTRGSLAVPTVIAAVPTVRTSSQVEAALEAPKPAATQSPSQAVAVPTSEALVSAMATSQARIAQQPATTGSIPAPQATNWWELQQSVEPSTSAELLRAYNLFWQVRAQALYELDSTQLAQVTAGPALEGEQRAIEQLKEKNQAQHVNVEHNPRILYASTDDAAIEDQYLSRSVLVDAESKQPLEPTPASTWRLAYRLRKIDGIWKVVDSVRVTYAQP
jgi:hypothetical protein